MRNVPTLPPWPTLGLGGRCSSLLETLAALTIYINGTGFKVGYSVTGATVKYQPFQFDIQGGYLKMSSAILTTAGNQNIMLYVFVMTHMSNDNVDPWNMISCVNLKVAVISHSISIL